MDAEPTQLSLFRGTLPKKPYCADDLTDGLLIRDVDSAIRRRYIQPNHPNSKLWLVFDIDRPTCPSEIVDDFNMPAPHIFCQNTHNGHAHAYYGLETAVHLNLNSSMKAIRFAAAVDCAFTSRLDADGQYTGLIAKNPLHTHWRTYAISSESYELGELAEYVDLDAYNDRRCSMPETGLGRNVNLFNRLRIWAYKAIRQGWPDYDQWQRACNDRAIGYNVTDNPLPTREVMQTAKSVAKWVFKHFNSDDFRAVQAARGAKKGQKARDTHLERAIEMSAQGSSVRAIAADLGVPKSTISRWLKNQVSQSHIR